MNSTMVGVIRGCKYLLIFVFLMFFFSKRVFAGSITGISYGPSGSVVGTFVQASDTDFVVFTPATALSAASTIIVTFPAGTTLTSGNILATDFTISQGTQGNCVTAGIDTAPTLVSVNASNRTITFTVSVTSLSSGVVPLCLGLGPVTIKTSAVAGGNEIQHPTTATTTGTLQIDTSVGSDTGSISTVSFVPAAANYLKVTGTGSVTAGSSNELTITAYDEYNNVVSSGSNNYTGSKSLTFSGPASAPSGASPTVEGTNVGSSTSITFTSGVSNTNSATLIAYKAETTTVDVSDGTINSTGDTSRDLDLTSSPGSLNDFTNIPSTTSLTTDDTFTVVLTARDLYQNTKTNYSGSKSVAWTWTSGGNNSPAGNAAVKPADGNQTFTSGITGTISGFKIVKAETATITATADTKSGTSAVITAGPGALNDFLLTTQHSQTETAGSSFNVLAVARDTEQNTKINYTGSKAVVWTWTATSSPDGDLPTKPSNGNETFATGTMTKAGFLLTDAGETPSITITADSKSGTTASITVNHDVANKLNFSTEPSSTATLSTNFSTQPVVKVLDQFGNTVTGSSASISLSAVLSSDDTTMGTGTLNATTNPLSASSGVTTFAGVSYTVAESIKLKAVSSGITQALSSAITVSVSSSSFVDSTSSSSIPSAPVCPDLPPGNKSPWLYAAVAKDSESALLYFTEGSDPVDRYVLQFGTKTGEYPYGLTNIGGKGTRTFLVQSLSPNTSYYFRIRAGNGCATGTWSNEISATTNSLLEIKNLNFVSNKLTTIDNSVSLSDEKSDKADIESVYSVKVKVIDTNNKPVKKAKVTLFSDPQETFTDENGYAFFSKVPAGEHRVVIKHEGYEGEQSLNLQGDDVKQFDLEITVKPSIWYPAISSIVIIFLIALIFRVRFRSRPRLRKR